MQRFPIASERRIDVGQFIAFRDEVDAGFVLPVCIAGFGEKIVLLCRCHPRACQCMGPVGYKGSPTGPETEDVLWVGGGAVRVGAHMVIQETMGIDIALVNELIAVGRYLVFFKQGCLVENQTLGNTGDVETLLHDMLDDGVGGVTGCMGVSHSQRWD
jgi:hypothetical protein